MISYNYLNFITEKSQNAEDNLTHLRSDFDALLKRKFESWAFTKAEEDIGILVLRGFSTSQIAELRSTKIGTVRLQIHKILQKSNTASRNDFSAVFMDEFLDFAAQEK